MGAVFVDLDRTLLRRASGPVLNQALAAEGVVRQDHALPGQSLLYASYDRFGESVLAIGLARAAARVAKGWRQEDVRRAAKRAVEGLLGILQPYARQHLGELRRDGHQLVLATTTPFDMVEPFADALDLDGVIATRYAVRDGRYTGHLDGGFVWGVGKLQAARRWARRLGIDLADSVACSDSVFDLPLLASVGHPRAVNPDARLLAVATLRRWPIEHWDRPPGVPSIVGLEPYHLLRPVVRPEAFPYARFDIAGVERIPRHGPVIVAANHRSYFDVAALAVVLARLGRPVRFLGKKEVFEAPVVGQLARALGGICVDRAGDPGRALDEARRALRAGEAVALLPQGTIPRGAAFFDPELRGRTGAARLAADTGAPVVPIGLWGTEQVWPRSSRLPDVTALRHPPLVQVVVGEPFTVDGGDPRRDTDAIMAAVAALLPPEARRRRRPRADELARTLPPGHHST